jgi:hypothetical protein
MPIVLKSGSLNLLEPSGLSRPVMGLLASTRTRTLQFGNKIERIMTKLCAGVTDVLPVQQVHTE